MKNRYAVFGAITFTLILTGRVWADGEPPVPQNPQAAVVAQKQIEAARQGGSLPSHAGHGAMKETGAPMDLAGFMRPGAIHSSQSDRLQRPKNNPPIVVDPPRHKPPAKLVQPVVTRPGERPVNKPAVVRPPIVHPRLQLKPAPPVIKHNRQLTRPPAVAHLVEPQVNKPPTRSPIKGNPIQKKTAKGR